MQKRIVQFNRILSEAIDRENGVIRGVSVITAGDAKGHGMLIDKTTLEQVVSCASEYTSGVRVNIGHQTGLRESAGYLREFRIEGDRVRADLHILKSETERDRIFEMAETIPETFGLSIAFSGIHELDKSGILLARCQEIYSADLVPEPAANPNGLFEQPKHTDEMEKEEILEIVNGVIEEKFTAFTSRLTALEENVTNPDEKEMAAKVEEYEAKQAELSAALDAIRTELTAIKNGDHTAELAKSIAKEFSAAMRVNGGGPQAAPQAPAEPVATFEDKVVELRKTGKTKGEAIREVSLSHRDLHADYLDRTRRGEAKSLEAVA
jgi:hypothetical protein